MTDTDRAEGVLLGVACGDALGRPVEGWPADRIEAEYGRLDDLVGGGVHRRGAGTLTDDTEQALCIARSLVERGEFDPDDVAERFVDWFEGGPVGIGRMTLRVLQRIADGEPWAEASRAVWEASPEGRNAGNGSVMRCAPLAVAYADDPDALARASRESSRITHSDPRCIEGCAVLNLTIASALNGEDRPLEAALGRLDDVPSTLRDVLEPVPGGVDPDALSHTGYVVDTLQAALFYALTAEDAENAIVDAVNAGGDTDTIGAVAGAVAGARFGASSLPSRWLSELDGTDELRRLGGELHAGEF